MRILITSDIHGNLDKLIELRKKESYDIHLDAGDSNMEDIALSSLQIVSVKGNTDYYSSLPYKRLINSPFGLILLTHGHIERVKIGLDWLYQSAKSNQANIVVFGHTHQQMVKKDGDILFINPGSLTFGNTYIILSKEGVLKKELY